MISPGRSRNWKRSPEGYRQRQRWLSRLSCAFAGTYALYGKWTEREIYFVTRLKDNARYDVLDAGTLPANRGNILADDLIQFTGDKAQKDCP